MELTALRQIVQEQREVFFSRKSYVSRDLNFKSFIAAPEIVVIHEMEKLK